MDLTRREFLKMGLVGIVSSTGCSSIPSVPDYEEGYSLKLSDGVNALINFDGSYKRIRLTYGNGNNEKYIISTDSRTDYDYNFDDFITNLKEVDKENPLYRYQSIKVLEQVFKIVKREGRKTARNE